MNTCPAHKLRADLPPLPPRLAKLPVDERGYPVPFFVKWIDGKPEFRMADPAKQVRCIRSKLCWVCGQLLDEPELAFTIGPMCAINTISSEPPTHRSCAEWSVKGCPFLSKPNMERRDHETIMAGGNEGGGVLIARNPGVTLIWCCYKFRLLDAPNKSGGHGFLWELDDPCGVSWWREGRPATRAEVMESITTGLPLLFREGAKQKDIDDRMAEIEPLLLKQ